MRQINVEKLLRPTKLAPSGLIPASPLNHRLVSQTVRPVSQTVRLVSQTAGWSQGPEDGRHTHKETRVRAVRQSQGCPLAD